ncbi:MAG: DUF4349 domain-containing protein [Chloroflexi bacterium]|nr:DUF4349 domain-containing protein [Chloroflexota bacterium]MBP8054457.1 DUF4349 domain-containing protein [Chloroflexota bacterium]
MQRKRLWILFLLSVLVLAACGGTNAAVRYADEEAGDSSNFYAYEEPPMAPAMENAAAAPVDMDGTTIETEAGSTDVLLAQNQAIERLIIRNGTLNILVTDTEAIIQAISQLAQQREGWVVSSGVYDYYPEGKQGTIFIRVPVAQFDTIMAEIKDLALEVQSESTNSEDVTDQYVDLTSRLSNLEATAERVRAFLDEAATVEEALAVNQELSRLEGEIEVLKGQMQYLSQSAAYSTINVSLIPDSASQPVSVAGWRPQGTAKEALENLVTSLQDIADFFIYFAIAGLPQLLIFGIPLYFIVRWVWRRWRRPVATAPVAPKAE